MIDSLYNQILDGLERLNDGTKFQSCAADLLRRDYPTLVPISGGNDAGFDGAAAQPDGPFIQLVCTTQDNVIGNLEGSLVQAKKMGQQSQAVLVATSRKLSPEKKRNLTEKAAEYGKTLLPVYDQEVFINLLYRDTHWRMELLGIAGTPPALSLLPTNLRPTFDLKLLGRDAELAAVMDAKRDLVVVGQPGSGKTHLLAEAARATGGLFLVAPDSTAIANGIREQEPKRVVVDDAFSRSDMLTTLCQVRKSLGADFLIIASCWPGQQDRIAAQLNITGEPVVELEPLVPKLIKEIITGLRITGPDELLHEILHQSAGKPGLAVTLCQLCWRGGTRGLFTGEALARDVKLSLEGMAGAEAVSLLAHYAIAGNAGLSVEAVAAVTGFPAITVRRQSEVMSAAGVLEVVDEQRLAVQPARLRQVLVRDMFFKPPALDWFRLVDVVPNRADLIETVIAAGLLGGTIDDGRLRALLGGLGAGSSRFTELCGLYARLGPAQSRWVLGQHPELAERVAEPLLEHIPGEVIPHLLRSCAQEDVPAWNHREDLKPIRKWIDDQGDTDGSLSCREMLLAAMEQIQAELKGSPALLAGVRHVLAVEFEWHKQTPGDPYQFAVVSGVVPLRLLPALARLWPRARKLLQDLPRAQAVRLAELVGDWSHPGMRVAEVREAYRAACQPQARQMLDDLLAMYSGQWTVIRRFDAVAEQLGRPLPDNDQTLAGRLFPGRNFQFDPEAHQRHEAAGAKLAAEWEVAGPRPDFIAEWVAIDAEGRAARVDYPNIGRTTAYFLARDTKQPAAWLAGLIVAGAPVDLVEPFVEPACAGSDDRRRDFIAGHLTHRAYHGLAVEQLLRHIPPGDPLWAVMTPLPQEDAGLAKGLVATKVVPEATIRVLLTDHGPAVARAVAAQMWSNDPEGKIPEGLRAPWREAVVTHLHSDHELPEIARRHPDLACAWVKRRLNLTWEERHALAEFDHDQYLPAVIAALNRDHRRELIDHFAAGNHQGHLLDLLVGDDLELFRQALGRAETRKLATQCLDLPGNPITFWAERATLLLDAGFTEEEVMWASHPFGGGSSGPISRHHEEKRLCFLPLLEHSDARIRRIGKMAEQFLRVERDKARKEEHRRAVRGEIG